MRPKMVTELILKALEKPNQTQPIFLEGPPGIGKSAIPRQITEDLKIGFVDIRLSQRDPTDLRGIPAIVAEFYCASCGKTSAKEITDCCKEPRIGKRSVAKWLPAPELPRDGKGILFLDEITSAPPLVQASAYQLTLDRGIAEYKLPDGYYIMAAGNQMEDRAVTYRMSTALCNRFTHIKVEHNIDDWVAWAFQAKINPNIVAFLRFRPELLFVFKPDSSEKAFATPRTWEFSSRILEMKLSRLVLEETLKGTVGMGATSEFMSFLKVQNDLPDLDEIFNGKDFVPAKLDLKYALVAALASRATAKQYKRMLEYSTKLPVEFAILLVMLLANRDKPAMLATGDAWKKWAQSNADVIIERKML